MRDVGDAVPYGTVIGGISCGTSGTPSPTKSPAKRTTHCIITSQIYILYSFYQEKGAIMELKIKPLSPKIGTDIPLPRFATAGAACMDLCACVDEAVTLNAGERRLVPTGIAIALPSPEYVALVFARSGLGIRKGVCLSNGVGVIDSDYRGEIGVGLVNLGDAPYTVQPGDRIAQLMVVPVVQPAVTVVDDLDETERGAGGFGSTGR